MRDEKFLALNEGFVTSQSFFRTFERGGLEPQIPMEVSDIFS
jgi:LysR family malonate utilization transcriptional regulator